MSQINWTNSYTKMEEEELNDELDRYTKRGFKYVLPSNQVGLENTMVITPWGIGLTKLTIEKLLSGKLIFGNRLQIEALDAIEFFKISEAL